jgi:hypothetical protein
MNAKKQERKDRNNNLSKYRKASGRIGKSIRKRGRTRGRMRIREEEGNGEGEKE